MFWTHIGWRCYQGRISQQLPRFLQTALCHTANLKYQMWWFSKGPDAKNGLSFWGPVNNDVLYPWTFNICTHKERFLYTHIVVNTLIFQFPLMLVPPLAPMIITHMDPSTKVRKRFVTWSSARGVSCWRGEAWQSRVCCEPWRKKNELMQFVPCRHNLWS